MNYKKFYSKYYDFVYDKKNYKKEVDFFFKLIKKNTPKIKKVLELGSGTGNHGKYIKEKGYNIIGVEKSLSMIRLSNIKKNNFKIYNCDLKKFRIHQKFDLIISLFHVINYMVKDSDINKFFETAKFHLNKGGYLLFDTWYTPAVKFRPPSKIKKIILSKEFKIIKNVSPKKTSKKTYNIKYNFKIFNRLFKIIDSFDETHKIRHFDIDELILFAKKRRFEFISSHKLFAKSKPSKLDWGATLIFKKI
jgi:SAM-dependent methyltransferase